MKVSWNDLTPGMQFAIGIACALPLFNWAVGLYYSYRATRAAERARAALETARAEHKAHLLEERQFMERLRDVMLCQDPKKDRRPS